MPNDVIASLSMQIDANTVKLRTEMDAAARETRRAASEIKASMTEGRAAIKQIGEEIGINLNRHLTSFIARLPGVAPLMAAAFPVAAVVGIGAAFVESGKRAIEWMQKQGELGKVLAEGFERLHNDAQMSNDELTVTNDKLQEQIDKLSGKHVNNLKLEIDELVVETEKLAKALRDGNKQVDDLLDKNKVGLFAQFMGAAGTGEASKSVRDHAKAVEDAQGTQTGHVKAVQSQIDALGHSREDELQKAKLAHDAKVQWDADEKEKITALRNAVKDLTEQWNKYDALQPRAGRGNKYGQFGGPDQTNNMTIVGGAANFYQDQLSRTGEDELNLSLTQRLKTVQSSREEMEKYLTVLHQLFSEGDKLWEEHNRLLEEGEKIQANIMQDSLTALQPNTEAMKAQTELFIGRAEAMHAAAAANKEASQAQQEWNIKTAESLGLITRQQAAVAKDEAAIAQLKKDLDDARNNLASVMAHPDLWTRQSNDQTATASVDSAQNRLDIAQGQLELDTYVNTFSGSMATMFNDWIAKATDVRAQMAQFWQSFTAGVNDTLVKSMTGEYKRGDWEKTFRGVLSGGAKSGLEEAEGLGMRALGIGGKGKLGTPGNPMHVIVAGGLPGVPGASGAASTASGGILGMLNDSNWASSLFGGKLFGAGGLFGGALADGGSFGSGYFLVGEHGPEIAHMGSGGYMHTASESRKMFSEAAGGSRGGDLHFHIDARGTDPSLSRANFERGMQTVHAKAVVDAGHAIHEQARRRPAR